MAPTLVLIFFCAQFPKALEAPDLLTKATMVPRITRNTRIPALSATAVLMESTVTMSKVVLKLQPAAIAAPRTIPIKSEEYASLVTRARTMATRGGRSAHPDATKLTPHALRTAMSTSITIKIADAIRTLEKHLKENDEQIKILFDKNEICLTNDIRDEQEELEDLFKK